MSPSQWMITGSLHLRQDAVIDRGVVVGRCGRASPARGYAIRMMRPPSLLDRRDLLFIGADHVVDRRGIARLRDDRCRRRKRPARRRAPSRRRPSARISSSEVGQSSPMPRCAVSIASATPRPRSQRCCAERDGRVPVDRRGRATDRSSASGSATTCAAEKATRLKRGARSLARQTRATAAQR